jgi:DNA-binding beta-propeller fold protein YncE
VSTYAGSATSSGFADGTLTAARFGYVVGLTLDTNGVMYVSDNLYNAVRMISASGECSRHYFCCCWMISKLAGVVSTIAGNPFASAGYSEGLGTSALLNYIYFSAISTDGKLYLADRGNNRIRRIDTAGLCVLDVERSGHCNDCKQAAARTDIIHRFLVTPAAVPLYRRATTSLGFPSVKTTISALKDITQRQDRRRVPRVHTTLACLERLPVWRLPRHPLLPPLLIALRAHIDLLLDLV